MENQEIDLHLYGQLHFDDDAKAIWWRKDSVQQMVLEKNGHPYIKHVLQFTPYS